jgi:anhydro-N-acetylmuramic acid kinase
VAIQSVTQHLFIGLMSGTSLDGTDGVLADFGRPGSPQVLAHVHRAFESGLRDELLALNEPQGHNELERAALASNGVSRSYHKVVRALLNDAGRQACDVRAIGAHGQTVRHRPAFRDGTGYTLQLLNGALLAELSDIAVVCDFRSRDVAAGGQGAPLVPAFHAAVFAQPGQARAVLNLGGIANLSLLPADESAPVRGFDTGPGNVLMDAWCVLHRGEAFDANGAWAASGKVLPALLDTWLAEPYFAKAPPKSTGRDLFTLQWLQSALPECASPEDVQASLLALTVRTVSLGLQGTQAEPDCLLVCGGGAYNAALMRGLRESMPQLRVVSTAESGVPPHQVEALAFAWLARAHVEGQTGNLPSVTGARGPRILGAHHPA